MKSKLDVYYFEQHIAKALSAIVGEKQLKEIYLNNSYQELKDLFNKHLDMSFGIQQDNIALDAFDFFCMQVDDCFNETNKYAKGLRMNSIVAEIFIIAEGEGKETEVKEIMKEFGKSKYNSPSSYKY